MLEVRMFLCAEGDGGELRDEVDHSKRELEICSTPLLFSFNDLCAALPPSQHVAAHRVSLTAAG